MPPTGKLPRSVWRQCKTLVGQKRSPRPPGTPDLPKHVPPQTRIRLVLPQRHRKDRPPLPRRKRSASATASSDAAGSAQSQNENIAIPELPPQDVIDLTGVPERLPSPTTAPPIELKRSRIYYHEQHGNVRFIGMKMGNFNQIEYCQVKRVGQTAEGEAPSEVWLVKKETLISRMIQKPKTRQTTRATDVAPPAANNTGFLRPMQLTQNTQTGMASINGAIKRETQYVREYDISFVKGKYLLATANYNLAADKSSCVDGKVCDLYPGLEKPVLSIRAGDYIRYIGMTGFENIAFGELVSPEYDHSRDAEMVMGNMTGCFSTLRCTFAPGNEPDASEGKDVNLLPTKRERERNPMPQR